MTKKPKVSIVTITYNHEMYIEEALRSFVNQKTNFDYEIIIADDCSTDRTASIIKKYAEEYPDVIKPILRKENIGAVANSIASLKEATGKYIALCEGDDFWTDNTKLQKQADFLDSNPDYSLCFHPVRVFFQDNKAPEYIDPVPSGATHFNTNELVKRNFIQTCSVMYRRQNYQALPNNVMPLDWYLHLYHASYGKIGFLKGTMSAYRRHAGGAWWGSQNDTDSVLQRHGLAWFNLYLEIKKLFMDDPHKSSLIDGAIITHLNQLHSVDEKYQTKLLREALMVSVDATELYVNDLKKQTAQLIKHSEKQAAIIQHYVDMSNVLKEENLMLKNRSLVKLDSAVRRHIKRSSK